MDKHTKNIKDSWDFRQESLGNSIQSVLYKNLPSCVNHHLHNSHIDFIRNGIQDNSREILDVGCGYGRISSELIKIRDDIKIEGIDLCKAYTEQFENEIGTCFHGTVQEYIPKKKFDTIIVVTILMYAKADELHKIVYKLWRLLKPGGRLVCIEQNMNILIRIRMLFGNSYFQPTGKNVIYFSKEKLRSLFEKLDGVKKIDSRSFGIIPILNIPVMHHGFIFEKKQN